MALPTRGLILWPGYGDGSGGGGGTADPATTSTLGTVKLSVAPASSSSPIAVGTNDSRMTDARTPTGAAGGDLAGTYPNPTLGTGVVTTSTLAALAVSAEKIADASITSAKLVDSSVTSAKINSGAVGSDALSTSITNVLPTSGQKDALAGTTGTPGASNKYVTDTDARLVDSRTPSGSAGGDLSGTYPNPTVASGAITSAKLASAVSSVLASSDEKAALAGTSGSPSSTNKFVTAADPRVIPTVSATIPSSPVDGQIWIYRDATYGCTWQFMYNAGSSSSYKWELIGGGPAVDHNTTSQTVSLGTGYTGAPTSSANVTVPFAGEYFIGLEMTGTLSASNLQVYMTVGYGTSSETASDTNAVFVTAHQTNAPVSTNRFDKLTAAAASTYFVCRWKRSATTTGSVTVQRHAVSALPIRVG